MVQKYYLHIVFCILWQNAVAVPRVDPLVDTKLGLIRGLKSPDGQYSMFMGIPYATLDETNPFGSSIPHQGFSEVFEAFDDSATCPQKEQFGDQVSGSLDCLRLNVYVPNDASSQNRLPVFVWIHGGGLTGGSGSRSDYGPKYLVKHNIVLVTLNYRLGPYGFMCLNNPKVPGNQGLKDQRTALKWVKDNIESFGGDANKITIFGESAGAASVGLHLHYQVEEKLFHQAIMQSGGPFSPSPPVPEPDREAALKLALHLGFETNDEDEALTFLSNVDPNLVIAAFNELNLFLQACVENDFGEDIPRFIGEHPINAKHPSLINTPVIIGFNSREELLDITFRDLTVDGVFRDLLGDLFDLDTDGKMEELIRHFYIGDNQVNEDSLSDVVDFRSDFKFNYQAFRSIKKYLESGASNLYHYVFSYDGDRNFVKKMHNLEAEWEGAAHADELGYLFEMSSMTDEPTPEDQVIIDRMTTLWSNFAKFGNPTPETSELLPVAWTPVSHEKLSYLDINTELSIKERPFHARTTFIELFYTLYEKAEIGYLNSDL